ncbi:MAG: sigma-70 family RNA polymerase sigma factor [archaeon]
MKEENFSLRLEMRVKNAKLIAAREALNLNAREFAERAGINYQMYLQYEGMKSYPPSHVIERICEFYKKHKINIVSEQVFPAELKNIKLIKKFIKEKDVPREELWYLSEPRAMRHISYMPNPEEELMRKEVSQAVESVLGTLSEREEKVVRMRYGLGNGEHKREEIAEYFDLSPERIRQIEARALDHMRHPSRSNKLKNAKWG